LETPSYGQAGRALESLGVAAGTNGRSAPRGRLAAEGAQEEGVAGIGAEGVDEVAAIEVELEHTVEKRESAFVEITVSGGADGVLERIGFGLVRVELIGDENDLADGCEIGVGGSVPTDAFEDDRVVKSALLYQPACPNGAMQEDGDAALDGIDGESHALGFLDQLRAGDVPSDVVSGCGELREVLVDGVGPCQVARDVADAVDVVSQALR